jgi:alkylhydroperoxidase/carboxymuconolactone decarboxylase family protein YurZ
MPNNDDSRTKVTTDQQQETGPWDAALDQLREWDPKWTETCLNMSTNPWTSGVLPRKTVELISVALNVACTNLNANGTRRHIRDALDAGATREEILTVFKMASVMSIHSCNLGASILLEEATMGLLDAASDERKKRLKNPEATPGCDEMRAAGRWNQGGDPFFELVPVWTEEFMAAEIMIYTRRNASQVGRTSEHRIQYVLHPQVCARHATSHQSRIAARRDDCGNRGGAEAVRRSGSASINLGVPILAN